MLGSNPGFASLMILGVTESSLPVLVSVAEVVHQSSDLTHIFCLTQGLKLHSNSAGVNGDLITTTDSIRILHEDRLHI